MGIKLSYGNISFCTVLKIMCINLVEQKRSELLQSKLAELRHLPNPKEKRKKKLPLKLHETVQNINGKSIKKFSYKPFLKLP